MGAVSRLFAMICGQAASERHHNGIEAASCLTCGGALLTQWGVPQKRLPPTNNPPPWQSGLEPFSAEIVAWKRANKSYRDIAKLLHSEKGFSVSSTTVSRFVKARRQRAKAKQQLLADLAGAPSSNPVVEPAAPLKAFRGPSVPAEAVSQPLQPFSNRTPQSDGRGLPLSRNEEIVGTDSSGRNITRNRPFKGKV